MKRIGLVASQMAQGNLCKYNWIVIGVSLLIGVILFLVSIFCVLGVLLVLSLIVQGFMHKSPLGGWGHIIRIAMFWIGIVVGLLTVLGIGLNIKLRREK